MQDDLKSMIEEVQKFCQDRDWDQFHPPKDLAIGISTEANELLDIFRFKSDESISELMSTPEFRQRVSDELADVFFFILRFSQLNKIDLAGALDHKIKKNAEKYPVAQFKGSNKKYNE